MIQSYDGVQTGIHRKARKIMLKVCGCIYFFPDFETEARQRNNQQKT